MEQKILKLLRWTAFVVGSVILLLAAGTLAPLPMFSSGAADQSDPAESRQILLLMNPIHTDLAIPLDAATLDEFAFAGEAGVPFLHPDARYLVIGWGGRDFYLETPTFADIKPIPLIKGLTLDRSVLHLDVVGAVPDGPISGLERIEIDAAAYRRLLRFIRATFTNDLDGAPVPIVGRSYGFTDRFFEAEGWFNAIAGCNVWVSKALRVAGVRTGLWTPLPQLLSLSIRLHN